jgi:O-antigen/teichoic acid export membrane protein
MILIATAIAGVIGYLITWLVPRAIGFADYSVYAIYWSFLFLVVSALSGIQQEVTRATSPSRPGAAHSRSPVPFFAIGTALVVFGGVVATAPAWMALEFPGQGWSLVWPLATGVSFYVLVAVISGSLYGVRAWPQLFWMISSDAIIRLVGIVFVLAFSHNVVLLAWMVAVPFPAVVILLWPWVRRSLVSRTHLDVDIRKLAWNVCRTILAAASMGLMVSGFPFLLGLTASNAPKTQLGLLILAITLTRAPLIVVVMALQSYLVVFFRTRGESLRPLLGRGLALIGIVDLVLAVAALLAGPPVFSVLFPTEPVPTGWLLAVLVASSGLVAALCVSGPAVLSRGRHGVYGGGWAAAALATIVCILLPLDLEARCILALLAGPLTGLAVHIPFLLGPSTRHRVAIEGEELNRG